MFEASGGAAAATAGEPVLFSLAGQKGFRSLPPDVADMIDRLKQERHI